MKKVVTEDLPLEGQMCIFDFIDCKPPIGSKLFVITGTVIRECWVLSQDAPRFGSRYITVKDKKGTIYYIASWYSNQTDAVNSLKSFYGGKPMIL